MSTATEMGQTGFLSRAEEKFYMLSGYVPNCSREELEKLAAKLVFDELELQISNVEQQIKVVTGLIERCEEKIDEHLVLIDSAYQRGSLNSYKGRLMTYNKYLDYYKNEQIKGYKHLSGF